MSCVRNVLNVKVARNMMFGWKVSSKYNVKITYKPTVDGPAIMYSGTLIPLVTSTTYSFLTLSEADTFASHIEKGMCLKCGHLTSCKDI